MKQSVSVVLRNQEDALVRLMGVFYRRGYVIESLSMVPGQGDNVRLMADVSCNELEAAQLLRHVAKLVDVVATEVLPCEILQQ